ncbi:MAG: hypothetical protein NTZ10_04770 [Candidatus Saganbacteria bacterium]|nr:hypothetical protein [Candidatus Saganbacteria bacterium]
MLAQIMKKLGATTFKGEEKDIPGADELLTMLGEINTDQAKVATKDAFSEAVTKAVRDYASERLKKFADEQISGTKKQDSKRIRDANLRSILFAGNPVEQWSWVSENQARIEEYQKKYGEYSSKLFDGLNNVREKQKKAEECPRTKELIEKYLKTNAGKRYFSMLKMDILSQKIGEGSRLTVNEFILDPSQITITSTAEQIKAQITAFGGIPLNEDGIKMLAEQFRNIQVQAVMDCLTEEEMAAVEKELNIMPWKDQSASFGTEIDTHVREGEFLKSIKTALAEARRTKSGPDRSFSITLLIPKGSSEEEAERTVTLILQKYSEELGIKEDDSGSWTASGIGRLNIHVQSEKPEKTPEDRPGLPFARGTHFSEDKKKTLSQMGFMEDSLMLASSPMGLLPDPAKKDFRVKAIFTSDVNQDENKLDKPTLQALDTFHQVFCPGEKDSDRITSAIDEVHSKWDQERQRLEKLSTPRQLGQIPQLEEGDFITGTKTILDGFRFEFYYPVNLDDPSETGRIENIIVLKRDRTHSLVPATLKEIETIQDVLEKHYGYKNYEKGKADQNLVMLLNTIAFRSKGAKATKITAEDLLLNESFGRVMSSTAKDQTRYRDALVDQQAAAYVLCLQNALKGEKDKGEKILRILTPLTGTFYGQKEAKPKFTDMEKQLITLILKYKPTKEEIDKITSFLGWLNNATAEEREAFFIAAQQFFKATEKAEKNEKPEKREALKFAAFSISEINRALATAGLVVKENRTAAWIKASGITENEEEKTKFDPDQQELKKKFSGSLAGAAARVYFMDQGDPKTRQTYVSAGSVTLDGKMFTTINKPTQAQEASPKEISDRPKIKPTNENEKVDLNVFGQKAPYSLAKAMMIGAGCRNISSPKENYMTFSDVTALAVLLDRKGRIYLSSALPVSNFDDFIASLSFVVKEKHEISLTAEENKLLGKLFTCLVNPGQETFLTLQDIDDIGKLRKRLAELLKTELVKATPKDEGELKQFLDELAQFLKDPSDRKKFERIAENIMLLNGSTLKELKTLKALANLYVGTRELCPKELSDADAVIKRGQMEGYFIPVQGGINNDEDKDGLMALAKWLKESGEVLRTTRLNDLPENIRKYAETVNRICWQLDQVDLVADIPGEVVGGDSWLSKTASVMLRVWNQDTRSLVTVPRQRISGEKAWLQVMLLKASLQPAAVKKIGELQGEIDVTMQKIKTIEANINSFLNEKTKGAKKKELEDWKKEYPDDYTELISLNRELGSLRRELSKKLSPMMDTRIDENFFLSLSPAISRIKTSENIMKYVFGQNMVVYDEQGKPKYEKSISDYIAEATGLKTFEDIEKFILKTIQRDGGWTTLTVLPVENRDTTIAKMLLIRMMFAIPVSSSDLNWLTLISSSLIMTGGLPIALTSMGANAADTDTTKFKANAPVSGENLMSAKNIVWQRIFATMGAMTQANPKTSIGFYVKFFNYRFSESQKKQMISDFRPFEGDQKGIARFNQVDVQDIGRTVTNLNLVLDRLNNNRSMWPSAASKRLYNLRFDDKAQKWEWISPVDRFKAEDASDISNPEAAKSEAEKAFSGALLDAFTVLDLFERTSGVPEASFDLANVQHYLQRGLRETFGINGTQKIPQMVELNMYGECTPEHRMNPVFDGTWATPLKTFSGVPFLFNMVEEALPWQTMPAAIGWQIGNVGGKMKSWSEAIIKGETTGNWSAADNIFFGTEGTGYEDGLLYQLASMTKAFVRYGIDPRLGLSKINDLWKTEDDWDKLIGKSVFWMLQTMAASYSALRGADYVTRRARGMPYMSHKTLPLGTRTVFRVLGSGAEWTMDRVGRDGKIGKGLDWVHITIEDCLVRGAEWVKNSYSGDPTKIGPVRKYLNDHPALRTAVMAGGRTAYETGRFSYRVVSLYFISCLADRVGRAVKAAEHPQDFIFVGDQKRQTAADLGVSPSAVTRRAIRGSYQPDYRAKFPEHLNGSGTFVFESLPDSTRTARAVRFVKRQDEPISVIEGDKRCEIFRDAVEEIFESGPTQTIRIDRSIETLPIGRIEIVDGNEIAMSPYITNSGAKLLRIKIGRERLIIDRKVISAPEQVATLRGAIVDLADHIKFVSGQNLSEIAQDLGIDIGRHVELVLPAGVTTQEQAVQKMVEDAMRVCNERTITAETERLRELVDSGNIKGAKEGYQKLFNEQMEGFHGDFSSFEARTKLLALTRISVYLFGKSADEVPGTIPGTKKVEYKYNHLRFTFPQMEAVARGYLGYSFNKECGGGKSAICFGVNINRWRADKGMSYSFTTDHIFAERDAECFRECYEVMGVPKVGVVDSKSSQARLRTELSSPVVYGSLYDFMVVDLISRTMPPAEAAFVDFQRSYTADEGEYFMIDMSKTPLILSGGGDGSEVANAKQWRKAAKAAKYVMSRGIGESDRPNIEALLMANKQFSELANKPGTVDMVINCMKAQKTIDDKKVYVDRVKRQVYVVDENVSKIMVDNRFNEGLHQALEAMCGFPIRQELTAIQSQTPQQFLLSFRGLKVFMSGTLTVPEVRAFFERLGIEVVELSRNVSEWDYAGQDADGCRRALQAIFDARTSGAATTGDVRLETLFFKLPGGTADQECVPVRVCIQMRDGRVVTRNAEGGETVGNETGYYSLLGDIADKMRGMALQNSGRDLPLIPSLIVRHDPNIVIDQDTQINEIVTRIQAEIDYAISKGHAPRPILIQTAGDSERGRKITDAIEAGLSPQQKAAIKGRVELCDHEIRSGKNARNAAIAHAGTPGITIGSFARADDIRVKGAPGSEAVRRGIMVIPISPAGNEWAFIQLRERGGRFIDSVEVVPIYSIDDPNIKATLSVMPSSASSNEPNMYDELKVAVSRRDMATARRIIQNDLRTEQAKQACAKAEEGLIIRKYFQGIEDHYRGISDELFVTRDGVGVVPNRSLNIIECAKKFIMAGVEAVIERHADGNKPLNRDALAKLSKDLAWLLGIKEEEVTRALDPGTKENLSITEIKGRLQTMVDGFLAGTSGKAKYSSSHKPSGSLRFEVEQQGMRFNIENSWENIIVEVFSAANRQLGNEQLGLVERFRTGLIKEDENIEMRLQQEATAIGRDNRINAAKRMLYAISKSVGAKSFVGAWKAPSVTATADTSAASPVPAPTAAPVVAGAQSGNLAPSQIDVLIRAASSGKEIPALSKLFFEMGQGMINPRALKTINKVVVVPDKVFTDADISGDAAFAGDTVFVRESAVKLDANGTLTINSSLRISDAFTHELTEIHFRFMVIQGMDPHEAAQIAEDYLGRHSSVRPRGIVISHEKAKTPVQLLEEIERTPQGSDIYYESAERIDYSVSGEQAAKLREYVRVVRHVLTGNDLLAGSLHLAQSSGRLEPFLTDKSTVIEIKTAEDADAGTIKLTKSGDIIEIEADGEKMEISVSDARALIDGQKALDEIISAAVEANKGKGFDPEAIRTRLSQSISELQVQGSSDIPLVIISGNRENILYENIAVEKGGKTYSVKISKRTIAELMSASPETDAYLEAVKKLEAEIDAQLQQARAADTEYNKVQKSDFLKPFTETAIVINSKDGRAQITVSLNNRTLACLTKCLSSSKEYKSAANELERVISQAAAELKKIGVSEKVARTQVFSTIFQITCLSRFSQTFGDLASSVSAQIFEGEIAKLDPKDPDFQKKTEQAKKKANSVIEDISSPMSMDSIFKMAVREDINLLGSEAVDKYLASVYQSLAEKYKAKGLKVPEFSMPAASDGTYNVREMVGAWQWMCLGAPGGNFGQKLTSVGANTAHDAASGFLASIIVSAGKNFLLYGLRGEGATMWAKTEDETIQGTIGWAKFGLERGVGQALLGLSGGQGTAFAIFLNTQRDIKSASMDRKLVVTVQGAGNLGSFMLTQKIATWALSKKLPRPLAEFGGNVVAMAGMEIFGVGYNWTMKKAPWLYSAMTSPAAARTGDVLDGTSHVLANKLYVQIGAKASLWALNLGKASVAVGSRAAGLGALIGTVICEGAPRISDAMNGNSSADIDERNKLYEEWVVPMRKAYRDQENAYIRKGKDSVREWLFSTTALSWVEGAEVIGYMKTIKSICENTENILKYYELGYLDSKTFMEKVSAQLEKQRKDNPSITLEQFVNQKKAFQEIAFLFGRIDRHEIKLEDAKEKIKNLVLEQIARRAYVNLPSVERMTRSIMLKADDAAFARSQNNMLIQGMPATPLKRDIQEQCPSLFREYIRKVHLSEYQKKTAEIQDSIVGTVFDLGMLKENERKAFEGYCSIRGVNIAEVNDKLALFKLYVAYNIGKSVGAYAKNRVLIDKTADFQIEKLFTLDNFIKGMNKEEAAIFIKEFNEFLKTKNGQNGRVSLQPTGEKFLKRLSEFYVSNRQGISDSISDKDIDDVFGNEIDKVTGKIKCNIKCPEEVPSQSMLRLGNGEYTIYWLQQNPNLVSGFRWFLESRFGSKIYLPAEPEQPALPKSNTRWSAYANIAELGRKIEYAQSESSKKEMLGNEIQLYISCREKAQSAFSSGKYDIALGFYSRIHNSRIGTAAENARIRNATSECIRIILENKATSDAIAKAIGNGGAIRDEIVKILVKACRSKADYSEFARINEINKEVSKAGKCREAMAEISRNYGLLQPADIYTGDIEPY